MAKKILIIEDEENIANLLKINLTGYGFDVEIGIDGEQGLSKIDSYQPDLVILDLRLPKITGLEILKKLKTSRICEKIKIVVVSASDQKITREQVLSLGAAAFYSKPIDVRVFIKDIQTKLITQ